MKKTGGRANAPRRWSWLLVTVVGDWNGDGIDTIGVFRNGQFLLRNSNTAGDPELVINLGQAGVYHWRAIGMAVES